MNINYLYEISSKLERVLSLGYQNKFSSSFIERQISYSPYFQKVEKSNQFVSSIINEEQLLKEIYPDINDVDCPKYNQCMWTSEAYLRIQENTGLTFECIFLYIPINKMYEYFPLYHEMDFSHIIEVFKSLHSEKSVLSILIDKYHYSLKDVSHFIDVSYDTLYSAKQRRRDIKKLDFDVLYKLSNVFNVRLETLTETSIS